MTPARNCWADTSGSRPMSSTSTPASRSLTDPSDTLPTLMRHSTLELPAGRLGHVNEIEARSPKMNSDVRSSEEQKSSTLELRAV